MPASEVVSTAVQLAKELTQNSPDAVEVEVEVMDIDLPSMLTVRKEKSKDVDEFFSPAYIDETTRKKVRNCRKCR